MIRFARLTKPSKKALLEINRLFLQLSSSGRQITLTDLRKTLSNKDLYVIVLRDKNRIIGMGSIMMIRYLFGLWGNIEDVVVDQEYRRQGLGKKLMKKLISIGKQKKVNGVNLTSRPSRVAANKLYKKLGFKRKETNFYQLKFKK
jgi:ribosomal protein S18 acetylase RimI-like enzyme